MKTLSKMENLKGSGLFKGKSNNAKNYPAISDTARSVDYGQVIEILCSGGEYGIEGIIPSLKEGTYLDETPLSSLGGENFKGITISQRRGTPFQPFLDGFDPRLYNEVAVGAEIKHGIPITRSFTGVNCHGIRVRLSFILKKNRVENGNVVQIEGTSAHFRIYIADYGVYLCRADVILQGKYSSPFQKTWYFSVNPTRTTNNFAIKIERINEPDDDNIQRVIQWESYSEITEIIPKFKRMAYVGIKFNTEEFGTSYPQRKYHLGGIKTVIPSNANVGADRGLDYFSLNWNGLFKQEFNISCADFFAITWYLLTDKIDGLGEYIRPELIDRFSLFQISIYNNQMIPNGLGGLERRYLFNVVFNKQIDAWKLIDSLCSACNVTRTWEGGILTFIQDKPQTPLANITNADVEGGTFTYSSSDIDDRATALQITWTDLQDFGNTKSVYVYDAALIQKNGYRLKQIEAVACTRQSQAIRLGRTVIYSENYENESVTFNARNFAAYLKIGTVINISDIERTDIRIGGLIKNSNNSSQVILDMPVEIGIPSGFDERFYTTYYPDVRNAIANGQFSSGHHHWVTSGQIEGRLPNGYLLYVMLPNLSLEFRRVIDPPGITNIITLESPFSVAPLPHTNWILFSPTAKPQLFRVISKEINEENPDLITVTAIQYNEYKWEYVERNLKISQSNSYVTYNTSLNKPTLLRLSKTSAMFGDVRVWNLTVEWNASTGQSGNYDPYSRRIRGYFAFNRPIHSTYQGSIKYRISYRIDKGDFQEEYETPNLIFILNNVQQGYFQVRIRAIDNFNHFSDYVYSSIYPLFFDQTYNRFDDPKNSYFADGL